jgi:deazaflavin-dependent oxidoreductase (nitroreductase family)
MSAQPSATPSTTFNAELIARFRANGGQIVDGPYKGAPLLLMTTVGARSGKPLVKPLAYTRDTKDFVVLASKSGAPSHPDWYRNLRAQPLVMIEVGREQFQARAHVVEGADRERLFASHAAALPIFSDYQQRTSRQIPVIVLRRLG